MEMRRILRVLGILCWVAAVAWEALTGPGRMWGRPFELAIVGCFFFYLATVLDRYAPLESLLKSSAPPGMARLKTTTGDFQRVRGVEGQATCLGCGKRAPKTDLYYSKLLNVYYHRECLVRDQGTSDQAPSSAGQAGRPWNC